MAFVITALTSDELNCRVVGGGDVDLGSVRRFFAASTVAGVLEVWRFDTRLGGLFT